MRRTQLLPGLEPGEQSEEAETRQESEAHPEALCALAGCSVVRALAPAPKGHLVWFPVSPVDSVLAPVRVLAGGNQLMGLSLLLFPCLPLSKKSRGRMSRGED